MNFVFHRPPDPKKWNNNLSFPQKSFEYVDKFSRILQSSPPKPNTGQATAFKLLITYLKYLVN